MQTEEHALERKGNAGSLFVRVVLFSQIKPRAMHVLIVVRDEDETCRYDARITIQMSYPRPGYPAAMYVRPRTLLLTSCESAPSTAASIGDATSMAMSAAHSYGRLLKPWAKT